MSRIRAIKPMIYFDEELAELPVAVRYFFIGLWTQADRDGKLEDRPRHLKAQIYPYENFDVESALSKLGQKFIQRYEVDGKKYIKIQRFSDHQRPHHTEAKSTIPDPLTVMTPLTTRPTPPVIKGLGREGKGEGGVGETDVATPSAPPSPSPKPPPPQQPYKTDTPLKKVICAWKLMNGFELDDRAWDKTNWKRHAPAAKELLDVFGGDWRKAIDCMEWVKKEMDKSKLSCSLQGVVLSRAHEYRVKVLGNEGGEVCKN